MTPTNNTNHTSHDNQQHILQAIVNLYPYPACIITPQQQKITNHAWNNTTPEQQKQAQHITTLQNGAKLYTIPQDTPPEQHTDNTLIQQLMKHTATHITIYDQKYNQITTNQHQILPEINRYINKHLNNTPPEQPQTKQHNTTINETPITLHEHWSKHQNQWMRIITGHEPYQITLTTIKTLTEQFLELLEQNEKKLEELMFLEILIKNIIENSPYHIMLYDHENQQIRYQSKTLAQILQNPHTTPLQTITNQHITIPQLIQTIQQETIIPVTFNNQQYNLIIIPNENKTDFIIMLEDLTPYQTIQEQLTTLKQTLKQTLLNTTNGIIIYDITQRITRINEKAQALLATIQKKDMEHILNAIFNHEHTINYYQLTNTQTNKKTWIQITRTPIYDEKHHITHIILTIQEKPTRKQTPIKQDMYENIIETLPLLILNLDKQNKTVYYQNKHATQLLGNIETLRLTNIMRKTKGYPKNITLTFFKHQYMDADEILEKNQLEDTELWMKLTNHDNNTIKYYYVYFQTITHHKPHEQFLTIYGIPIQTTFNHEQHLTQHEAQHETELAEEITDLIEKKESIIKAMKTLKHYLEARIKQIETKYKTLQSITTLTNDEDFQAIQALMKQLLNQYTELQQIGIITPGSKIRLSTLLKTISILLNPSQTVKIEPPKQDYEFKQNIFAIQEILLNLIDNAIKHNPNPQKIVKIIVHETDDTLILEIHDNGKGINNKLEQNNKLKAYSFKTNNDSYKEELKKSTRLGFSLILSSLERLKGSIAWTQSKLLGGTQVLLELPKSQL